jgi:hypothetical protein
MGKTCRSSLLYQYAIDNDLSLTEDIRIELICECPCDNKEQLNAFEGKYIRQYKEEYGEKCVNKKITGRTDKQYYEDNKDKRLQQQKEYNQKNKDKIKAYNQQYREDNKDKRAEQKKEWYEDNKEKLLQQQKEYNEQNKDKIKAYKQQYYLFKKIDKMFGL